MKKQYIFTIVIILAVVGVFGYIFVKNRKQTQTSQKQQENQSNNQIATNTDTKSSSTIPTITLASSTIDTTNWKTYRSEQYGFEFKYPDDWNVAIDTVGFLSFQSKQIQDNIRKNNLKQDPYQYFDFGIYVYNKINNFHYYNNVTAGREFNNLDDFFNYVFIHNVYYPSIKINGILNLEGVKAYDTDDSGDFVDNYVSFEYKSIFFDLLFPTVDINSGALIKKNGILYNFHFIKK